VIELQGIAHTYAGPQGSVQALRGIDLSVQQGAILGVIGRSGAGKSSLIRTINLLNQPSTGRVWVDGQDLTVRLHSQQSTEIVRSHDLQRLESLA